MSALEKDRSRKALPARTVGAAALLIGITLAAYVPALGAGFIWDDDDYVVDNELLRSWSGLRRIWLEPGATPQYYPLVHTTYWLEYRLWGLDPRGYHAVNILLHAAAAVLLWRVLRRLDLPGAWLAAAVFAVHPVHVESVAWITERKNVLSGVLYLGSALAYLHHVRRVERAGRAGALRSYLLSLGLFVCALLSKTVTATLPVALLLIRWWKRGRVAGRDLAAQAPFLAVGLALSLVTIRMEKAEVGAVGEEWDLSLIERLLVAGRAIWFYAWKLLWPHPLAFIYPRWQVDGTALGQYLFPLGVAAVLAVLFWQRRRIGRGPLVACLFCIVTLLPALGFFDVYPMRYSFVADHFQYVASIGLISLAVAGTMHLLRRVEEARRRVAPAVAAAVILVLGTITWHQARAYQDAETLWRDTLRKNPAAWIAHNNLGTLLRSDGKLEEAVVHYREVLRLKPDHAEAHYNWANALAAERKYQDAVPHYREAIRIRPSYAKAHFNLATTLVNLGRVEESLPHYREGLRLHPQAATAHFDLGLALYSTGRAAEALGHIDQAARLVPDWVQPRSAAAWILATHPDATVRDPQRAMLLARQVDQWTRQSNPQVLDTLAAAYAATGEFERAVEAAERALLLSQREGDQAHIRSVRLRLEMYRSAQPYHESIPPREAIPLSHEP